MIRVAVTLDRDERLDYDPTKNTNKCTGIMDKKSAIASAECYKNKAERYRTIGDNNAARVLRHAADELESAEEDLAKAYNRARRRSK